MIPHEPSTSGISAAVARQLRKIGYGNHPDAESLKVFQRAKGLKPDGESDPQTERALRNTVAVRSRSKDMFITGMKAVQIWRLESRLEKLGYQVGAHDGVMDEKLADAVVRYKSLHPELQNVGRYAGKPVRELIAREAALPRVSHRTPSGLAFPLGRMGPVIGRPGQGTHTRGNWQSDNALDIRVPVGTPIYATTSGVIGPRIGPLNSGDPRLAGHRLTLVGGKNQFYYAHLSRLSVRAGQHVVKGQLLGYSGSANGTPHLHFATLRGDPGRLLGV